MQKLGDVVMYKEIKNFKFKVKSHIELGAKDENMDFDTSTKLSGSRFVVLKDKFAISLKFWIILFLVDAMELLIFTKKIKQKIMIKLLII